MIFLTFINCFKCFYSKETKDFDFDVPYAAACLSKHVEEVVKDDDKGAVVTIPPQFAGKLIKKAFEFCQYYKMDPFKEVTHPLDNYKPFNNYYNDLMDDLCKNDIVCLLTLADYLDIQQLIQLICYRLSYLMRDIEAIYRLDFFSVNGQWLNHHVDI